MNTPEEEYHEWLRLAKEVHESLVKFAEEQYQEAQTALGRTWEEEQ